MTERSLHLSPEVKSATPCPIDFVCLHGKGDCLCPVQLCVDAKVCFIELVDKPACKHAFAVAFGFGHICTCPSRLELHNKYAL